MRAHILLSSFCSSCSKHRRWCTSGILMRKKTTCRHVVNIDSERWNSKLSLSPSDCAPSAVPCVLILNSSLPSDIVWKLEEKSSIWRLPKILNKMISWEVCAIWSLWFFELGLQFNDKELDQMKFNYSNQYISEARKKSINPPYVSSPSRTLTYWN